MPAAPAADDYPGLPIFSLSAAPPIGDPERQRLNAAANWAALTGNWARHFTEFKNALVKAADGGSDPQRVQKLERILTLPTPTLVMEQGEIHPGGKRGHAQEIYRRIRRPRVHRLALRTAKANGVPAMVISGEGDRGGHAWFGYGVARMIGT